MNGEGGGCTCFCYCFGGERLTTGCCSSRRRRIQIEGAARVNTVPNKQLLGFDCVLQCQFRQQRYDRTENLVLLHTGQYCWKPFGDFLEVS
jgi:hypothetical protein